MWDKDKIQDGPGQGQKSKAGGKGELPVKSERAKGDSPASVQAGVWDSVFYEILEASLQ